MIEISDFQKVILNHSSTCSDKKNNDQGSSEELSQSKKLILANIKNINFDELQNFINDPKKTKSEKDTKIQNSDF